MFETAPDRKLPPITLLELTTRDGSPISVHELRERFFTSEYGEHMYGQALRFSQRYGYDRTLMRQDLGGDVCPVGHQYELTEHLQIILDGEQAAGSLFQLSEQEQAILAFTCSIHDIGECEHPDLITAGLTPVGDIPAGGKTDVDRANEAAVRTFFYDQFYSDIDPAIIERVEAIIAHKDTTILHELFEAAHELQTLDTIARAERAITTPEIVEEQKIALASLINTVPAFHRAKLKDLDYFAVIRSALAQS